MTSITFVLLILVLLFATGDCAISCGNGYCEDGESMQNCFRDCAAERKYKCPFNVSNFIPPGVPTGDDTIGQIMSRQMNWNMPGLEHIAQGIDTVSGKETGHFIFDLQYCENNPDSSAHLNYVYRGNTYTIPQGVHIIGTPQCSLSASTEIYSYASSFAQSMAQQNSMSISVSAKVHAGSFFNAAASASYSQDSSVEQANSMTRSGKVSIAITSAQCHVYKFTWIDRLDETFGNNYLHPDFANALNNIQTASEALDLVSRYGTHFYVGAIFGGKLQKITTISDSFLKQNSESAVSQAISKSFSAEVSAKGFGSDASVSSSGTLDESGSQQTVSDSEMSSNIESSSVTSFGGAPFDPTSSSFEDWASSIDTLPVVIKHDLEEILTIIPNVLNKYDKNIRSLWMQAVNEYMIANNINWANEYTLTVETLKPLSGKTIFGPFAYFIPSMMHQPALCTLRGSAKAHLFIAGLLSQIDVPLKTTLPETISYIDMYSMKGFASEMQTGSIFIESSQFVEMNVTKWPVDQISFFDAAAGKSYLFGKQSPQEFAEQVRLYRKGRTGYQVEISMFTGTPTNGSCIAASFASGGLQLNLYGGNGSISEYYDMSTNTNPLSSNLYGNSFKISSSKDIGELSAVEFVPIFPQSSFCLRFAEIRVIALDDNVYVSSISPYVTLNYTYVPTYNGASADAIYNSVLAQQWINPDVKADHSTLYIALNPWSDLSFPSMHYGYIVTLLDGSGFTFEAARAACLDLGGVIASHYFATRIQESEPDWCNRGWIVEDPEYPRCTYLGTYATCSTPLLACGATCIGPIHLNSTFQGQKYRIAGTPVPVVVTFSTPKVDFQSLTNNTPTVPVIQVTNCITINTVVNQTQYVELVNDITTTATSCFTFTGPGRVVFEGNNRMINFIGDDTQQLPGIEVNTPYSTIRNVVLAGYPIGIMVQQTAYGCTLDHNTVRSTRLFDRHGYAIVDPVRNTVIGIYIKANSTTVTNNIINGLQSGYNGEVIGIYSSLSSGHLISNNVISYLSGGYMLTIDIKRLRGIWLDKANLSTISSNSISYLTGNYFPSYGIFISRIVYAGFAVGIQISNSDSILIYRNTITNIVGGASGLQIASSMSILGGDGVGVDIKYSQSTIINDNFINGVIGGTSGQLNSCSYPEAPGGNSYGIENIESNSQITNNELLSINAAPGSSTCSVPHPGIAYTIYYAPCTPVIELSTNKPATSNCN